MNVGQLREILEKRADEDIVDVRIEVTAGPLRAEDYRITDWQVLNLRLDGSSWLTLIIDGTLS